MRTQTYTNRIKIVVLENGLISTYTAREALMKKLVALNYDVYVLTHTNKYQLMVEEMGINVININSANFNPVKIGKYFYELWKCLKVIQPDLCLTFSVRPAILGNLVARVLNIPVITNITGTGPLFASNSTSYKLIRKIYPFALKKTDIVFFQNFDDRDEFIKRGFTTPSKSFIIPGSGVDSNKFKPVKVEKKPEDKFTFLFIGRLLKDKGVYDFIEAARLIKRKYENVRFKIIGPIWELNSKVNQVTAETVQSWVEEGLINYAGEKSDIREDLAFADCLVLPSYREGISNVLLEASAMERPSIATNVPGCKEIIEDGVTGMLCRLKDPEDLASKMEKMFQLSQPEREAMGAAARRKVIAEFDKQVVIHHYLEAIDESLARSTEGVFVFPANPAFPVMKPLSSRAI